MDIQVRQARKQSGFILSVGSVKRNTDGIERETCARRYQRTSRKVDNHRSIHSERTAMDMEAGHGCWIQIIDSNTNVECLSNWVVIGNGGRARSIEEFGGTSWSLANVADSPVTPNPDSLPRPL